MKNGLFIMFFCCFFLTHYLMQSNQLQSNAITYELNGGRFGDNLLSYSRAKWISYLYDIPLQIFPFPYADQLMLYENERMLCLDQFNHVVRLNKISDILKDKISTLYINHWRVNVDINWNDMDFIAQLREMIAPRYDIQKVVIPEGYLSVAVHVRKGGAFVADTVQEQERCPLRFVSDEFYIEQIDRITQMFPDQQLYVYLFTDYKNPNKLAKKFSEALSNDNILFDYQKEENGPQLNVLEDFFSMMQFDCLIRPGSHFSRFVERLGNAQLSIYPYSYATHGKETVIDVIGVKTRVSGGKWKTVKVSNGESLFPHAPY